MEEPIPNIKNAAVLILGLLFLFLYLSSPVVICKYWAECS